MRGSYDGVTPELLAKQVLEHVEHILHGYSHPIVILLEQDYEHMEVAEVVFEPIDHRLNLIRIVPEINADNHQV